VHFELNAKGFEEVAGLAGCTKVNATGFPDAWLNIAKRCPTTCCVLETCFKV
jgi:hypothetical protein